MKLYAIFDKKAALWLSPFTAPSDVQAARSVVTYMKQQSTMSDFAEDYELYVLGTYDEQASHPVLVEPLSIVITGVQAKAMALEITKSDS